MLAVLQAFTEVYARPSPVTNGGPGLRPGVDRLELCVRRGWTSLSVVLRSGRSALTLLVARVSADDHDPAVPADHPAFVADPLDARLDLHGFPFSGRVDVTCTGRRCGHGSGRTGKVPPRPGPPAGCGCSAAASCR